MTSEVMAQKYFLTDEVTITRIDTVQSLRSVQIVPIVETVLLLICFSLFRVWYGTTREIRQYASRFLSPSARKRRAPWHARRWQRAAAYSANGPRTREIPGG